MPVLRRFLDRIGGDAEQSHGLVIGEIGPPLQRQAVGVFRYFGVLSEALFQGERCLLRLARQHELPAPQSAVPIEPAQGQDDQRRRDRREKDDDHTDINPSARRRR